VPNAMRSVIRVMVHYYAPAEPHPDPRVPGRGPGASSDLKAVANSLQVRAANPDDTRGRSSRSPSRGWRSGYRDIVAPDRLADLPIERWRHEVAVGLRRPVADAFTYVAAVDGGFAGYCYVAAPIPWKRKWGPSVALKHGGDVRRPGSLAAGRSEMG